MHSSKLIITICLLVVYCRDSDEIGISKLTDGKCQYYDGTIICNHVNNISEISYKDMLQGQALKRLEINLVENSKIVLDKSIGFENLLFSSDFVFKIKNANGIDMQDDLFEKVAQNVQFSAFYYENSNLDIYVGSELITKCSVVESQKIKNSLFSRFKYVHLLSNSFGGMKQCPLVFSNTNIERLIMNDLNETNKLEFENTDISNLNSTIYEMEIWNSSIKIFDKNILNKNLFKNIHSIYIYDSNLEEIEAETFKNLDSLKQIIFSLTNFEYFISKNNEWMKDLNSNLKASIPDGYQSKDLDKNYFTLKLFDLNKTYLYEDKDFCYFKDFPHDNMVFPYIFTKEDLKCTCTIAWLLKNYKIANDFDIKTPSVMKCLEENTFDKLINECQFEDRLKTCNTEEYSSTGSQETTEQYTGTPQTTVSHSTTKYSNETKRLSLVFLILVFGFGYILVCLLVTFIESRSIKAKDTEELRFEPLNDDDFGIRN